MKSPVWVTGLGGSGTRILPYILIPMGYRIKNCNDSMDTTDFTGIFNDFAVHYLKDGLVPDGVEGQLRGILEVYYNELGARFILKNPRSTAMFPWLYDVLKDFTFVHVVRDGRDMAFSRNRGQIRDYGSALDLMDHTIPENVLQYWAVVNHRVYTRGMDGTGRYYIIRYEDLCTKTIETVTKLMMFLGIPASEKEIETVSFKNIGQFPPNIGRYKKYSLVVNEFCSQVLKEFGYE